MSKISLKADLRQDFRLTPQLLQSIEILQMNSQELLEYVNQQMMDNPVLEQDEISDLMRSYDELRQRASWIDPGGATPTFFHEASEAPEAGAADRELELLSTFLRDQLDRLRLNKQLLALCHYLAQMVDDDGYLAQEDLDHLEEIRVPRELLDQALSVLQSLDPAGVGARDLTECLCLQLRRQEDVPPYTFEIVKRFLKELGQRRYGVIARELGLSDEEIRMAEKRIAELNPRPGQICQPTEPTVYIRPDLFIIEEDGTFQVVMNEYYLPRIRISDFYRNMYSSTDEKETHAYLQAKLKHAKWLLNNLEMRGSTLRRCAQAILDRQMSFFKGESVQLQPMTLAILSEELQLNPSTISRAVRHKYLQCKQGTFPLKYFFNRSVGGDTSRQAIRMRVAALIQNEEKEHPLSDEKICRRLRDEGIDVARRTVAKYREELGLGSSAERRRDK